MRFGILALAVYLSFVLSAPQLYAQFLDDPAVESTDELVERDELVRQLESTAGQGGRNLAQSIQSLVRVGAWESVDRWIARYDSIADEAELAQAARIIGNDYLLRISLREDLSDNSQSAVNKLFAAARRVRQNPDRLRAAISKLGSSATDDVLGANRILTAGGEAAVKELVDALAKGVTNTQRPRVLSLLRTLGDGGRNALAQLATYGADQVRPRVLSALVAMDRGSAMEMVVASAFAVDSTEQERRVAFDAGLIPQGFEELDGVAVLTERLNSKRMLAAKAANNEIPATLWSVGEQRIQVQPTRSTEIYLRYRDAYDAAQRLRRMGSLPPSSSQSALAADVAYRIMVDIDWNDPEQIKQVLSGYPEQSSSGQLMSVLAEQRRRRDIPATIGVLRMIAHSVEKTVPAQSMAALRQGTYSALVDTVRDAQPRIRYEAATILYRLLESQGGDASFAGASYYRSTLSEMAALGTQPIAVLIETRPVVALRQETILGQLGYQIRVVKSALQAEQEIRRGGNFQLLVTKVQVVDASAPELVDRVRRLPKGSQVPIVIYSDAESNEKSVSIAKLETTSRRWADERTPAVFVVPLPGNAAAYQDVLREMSVKRRLPELSPGDLAQFRLIGQKALQGLSK